MDAVRRAFAIARRSERERLGRLRPDACPKCGHHPARIGPFLVCRNLACGQLVVR